MKEYQVLFKYCFVALCLYLDLRTWYIYELLTHSENKQRVVIENVVCTWVLVVDLLPLPLSRLKYLTFNGL